MAKIAKITSPVPMATTNVSLPDPMKAWVESRARTGRYSNAGDYARDLIGRDQARERAIGDLQGLIDEGLESGPSAPLDKERFLEACRRRHKASGPGD